MPTKARTSEKYSASLPTSQLVCIEQIKKGTHPMSQRKKTAPRTQPEVNGSLPLTPALEASTDLTNALVGGPSDVWGEAQTWHFGNLPIRTITRNGDPWFVLMDVCAVLGIRNAPDAASRLKPTERHAIVLTDSIRQAVPDIDPRANSLIVISESGFYRLVLRSDKPEAEFFQTWATETVLPTIRKTGSYAVDQGAALLEALRDPTKVLTIIGDYATRLLAANARVEQASMQRDEATARAEVLNAAHEQFASHEGTFTITIAAKTLDIPPGKLFDWMAANKWIYRPGGPASTADWAAYQPRVHQKVLLMKAHPVTNAKGIVEERSRVRVTTKGLSTLAKAFKLPPPSDEQIAAASR